MIRFHETILASDAEADRGEVISHEQLEKASKKWINKANHRKNPERGSRKKFEKVLSKVPDVPPEKYDRL